MKKQNRRNARRVFHIFLCTALCILTLFLASCGHEEEGITIPDDMQAVTSEAGDYILVVPSSWLTDSTVGLTSAYADDEDRCNVNVMANELDSLTADPVGDYWASYEEQFAAAFPDFAMTDAQPSDVTVGSAWGDGIAAKRYRFSATVGGVSYRFSQTIFVRNATIYMITYTSTEDDYENHTDDVSDIIAYFYFT